MNFDFTEEQTMLQQAVRAYVKERIAPYAAEWDEKDICPVELFPELGELGVLGIFVPEEYGGVGMGHMDRAICLEEIARYSAGFTTALFAHHLSVGAVLDFGTEEQKKKYLPGMCDGTYPMALAVTEPSAGTDMNGAKTTAELGEDGMWHLNGRKCFCTNASIAEKVVVTAVTDHDKKGRPLLTMFIVDKNLDGFALGRDENKLGLRGSVTGEVILSDVKVSPDDVVGEVNKGKKIALKQIGEIGRAGMSAVCVGILRGCIEETLKFTNERIIYGKPLSNLQAIQFAIAEMRVDYEAARLLTLRAAYMKDKGLPTAPFYGMAKYLGTNGAVRSAQRAIEAMGGYGVINEYPVGRYFRDAMTAFSTGGTTEVQKMVIYAETAQNFM